MVYTILTTFIALFLYFIFILSFLFKINLLTKNIDNLIKNSIRNKQKHKQIKQKIINSVSLYFASSAEIIKVGSPHIVLGVGGGKSVLA